ncbi:hypothetical protein GN244_ATG00686 [Phytophthora infestans]|uniref:Uncharacterized protein n=1 Tax=Phytophthora infestans TaxID=4787 RepID=A0A833T4L3_PHYIN|nr:hypothetical protein GN244_ATG00686 [Phytophthora infestans]
MKMTHKDLSQPPLRIVQRLPLCVPLRRRYWTTASRTNTSRLIHLLNIKANRMAYPGVVGAPNVNGSLQDELSSLTSKAERNRGNDVHLQIRLTPVISMTSLKGYTTDNVKDLALGIRQVVFAVARQQCANTQDRYYVRLTGHGGSGGSTSGDETKPGEHEAVLVLPVRWSGERLAEHSFFYTGSVHNYRVPIDQFGPHLAHRIVALDVYAWGAGRAGERSSNGASSDLRNGVFARGVLRARAGDFVDILVGGGGLQNVRGGFNGGGNGGTGDFPAVVRLTCAWMDEQPS